MKATGIGSHVPTSAGPSNATSTVSYPVRPTARSRRTHIHNVHTQCEFEARQCCHARRPVESKHCLSRGQMRRWRVLESPGGDAAFSVASWSERTASSQSDVRHPGWHEPRRTPVLHAPPRSLASTELLVLPWLPPLDLQRLTTTHKHTRADADRLTSHGTLLPGARCCWTSIDSRAACGRTATGWGQEVWRRAINPSPL